MDRALTTARGTGDQKKSTLKSAKSPILPNHDCSSLHQYSSVGFFPAVFLSCTAPDTRSAYRAKYHPEDITESIHPRGCKYKKYKYINITQRISQSPSIPEDVNIKKYKYKYITINQRISHSPYSSHGAGTWNSVAHWKKSLMSTSQTSLKCRIYKMYDQLPKIRRWHSHEAAEPFRRLITVLYNKSVKWKIQRHSSFLAASIVPETGREECNVFTLIFLLHKVFIISLVFNMLFLPPTYKYQHF